VQGNYAYVTAKAEGLYIFNISDPANPYQVATYNVGGIAYGVFAEDTLVYLAYGSEGLHILNVKNPQNPEFVDKYIVPDVNCYEVFVENNLIFLAYDTSVLILRFTTK